MYQQLLNKYKGEPVRKVKNICNCISPVQKSGLEKYMQSDDSPAAGTVFTLDHFSPSLVFESTS